MRGWFSGPGIGVLDTRYLRLDASNDPVTAGLEVNAATTGEPVLILQTTDDNAANPILEIQASGGGMLAEIEKDGNLNFATATAANPGMVEVNDTRFLHLYGTDNLFIGEAAGNFTLTGNENVGIGEDALAALTTGYENTAIGFQALIVTTTGRQNVAIGRRALLNNVDGIFNMAIGTQALLLNVSGIRNVALGGNALQANLVNDNMAIGYQCLTSNTTGGANCAIGTQALAANTTNNDSTAIGRSALLNSTGRRNTVIGRSAGSSVTTGQHNLCLGYQAGNVITTGDANIIIGYDVDPSGAAVNSELNIGGLLYGDLANNMGGVNVTPPSLAAAWHVDQATADAAIPVLLLDQADVSEEMIEFVSTIGVGNAIEAAGGKVLTTTHFIKITLPGGLTRYIPAGTIA